MSLAIKRELVDRGLFPWFVSDIKKHQAVMQWSLPDKLALDRRVGLYFEMSDLPSGSHPWDFWISFK